MVPRAFCFVMVNYLLPKSLNRLFAAACPAPGPLKSWPRKLVSLPPVGVVRVLVGDLIQANLVSTFDSDAAIRAPDDHILQAVLDGLRSL